MSVFGLLMFITALIGGMVIAFFFRRSVVSGISPARVLFGSGMGLILWLFAANRLFDGGVCLNFILDTLAIYLPFFLAVVWPRRQKQA